jgi:hypothetical protein
MRSFLRPPLLLRRGSSSSPVDAPETPKKKKTAPQMSIPRDTIAHLHHSGRRSIVIVPARRATSTRQTAPPGEAAAVALVDEPRRSSSSRDVRTVWSEEINHHVSAPASSEDVGNDQDVMRSGNSFTRTASWMRRTARRTSAKAASRRLSRRGSLSLSSIRDSVRTDEEEDDLSSRVGPGSAASTLSSYHNREQRQSHPRRHWGGGSTISSLQIMLTPAHRTRAAQTPHHPQEETSTLDDHTNTDDDLTWDDAHNNMDGLTWDEAQSSLSSCYMAIAAESTTRPSPTTPPQKIQYVVVRSSHASTTSSMRGLAYQRPPKPHHKRIVYANNNNNNNNNKDVQSDDDVSWDANSSIASSCLLHANQGRSPVVKSTTRAVTRSHHRPASTLSHDGKSVQEGLRLTADESSLPDTVPSSSSSVPSNGGVPAGSTISPNTSLFAILSDESADEETQETSLSSTSYTLDDGEKDWASMSSSSRTGRAAAMVVAEATLWLVASPYRACTG